MRMLGKTVVSFAAMAALAVLGGCPVASDFSPRISSDETALFEDLSIDNGAGDTRASLFTVSSWTTPAVPDFGTTDAVVKIGFQNGVVDASSIDAGGITIYCLKNAADNESAYLHGTTLPFTYAVDPTVDGCTVTLTFDIKGSKVSSMLEGFLDPAVLTAAGGGKPLNSDGDDVPGEPEEDAACMTFSVPSAPVSLTTGCPRKAPGSILSSILPSGFAVSGTTLTSTARNCLTTFTHLTADSLVGSETWERFSGGEWVPVSVNPSYDSGSGTFTHTFPAAFKYGEVYRWSVDLYQYRESSAVAGYVHRGSNAQNDPARIFRYVYDPVGTTFGTVDSVLTETVDGSRYVHVLLDGSRIPASSLTSASVRVYDHGSSRFIPWISGEVYLGNQLMLRMPPGFSPPAGGQFDLWISPELMDDAGTDDASDDVPYGDTARWDGNLILANQNW
jgi:hypothetical protein